jgi:predicted adenine nucleotide alpha hydrolase (AANH) superfamily ATPase
MSWLEVLTLALIIATFIAFGVILAWGEYQTRNFNRDVKQAQIWPDRSSQPNTVIQLTLDRTRKVAEESGVKEAA